MSKIARINPINDIEDEFNRIQSLRTEIKRYIKPYSEGPKHGYVISWYYQPTTSVRGIAAHRLLKYSKNQYSVLFNNENGKNHYEYGPNINPIPSHFDEYPYATFQTSEWYNTALTTYSKLSVNQDIDFIFTNSVPIPEHRIGLEIKKRDPFEKWVAFFSDPMSNNDHFTFYKRAIVLKETNGKDWEKQLSKEKNNMREYEIDIYEQADLLLFPQETLAQFMLGDLYEHYKFKVGIVPHSFEGYVNENTIPSNDKIVFSFVGSLYAMQNINDLSKAIKMLKRRIPRLSNKIVINLVGRSEECNMITVEKDGVGDVIKFRGEMEHDVALNWMLNSDYLLSLQPRMADRWLGFIRPAKLADYMSVRRPILLFGDALSESEKFATNSNNIFCLQSPDVMADLFQAIIEGRIGCGDLNYDFYNQHLSSSVSSCLDAYIEKMLKE